MRLATLLTCLLLLASAAHGAADPARALGQQRMLAYVRDGTLRTDYAARAARRLAAAEGPPAAERLARELRTAGLRVRDRAEGEPLVADWTGRSRATEIVLLRACLPVAHEGDAEAAAIAGVMQAYASLRLRPQRTVRVAFVPATGSAPSAASLARRGREVAWIDATQAGETLVAQGIADADLRPLRKVLAGLTTVQMGTAGAPGRLPGFSVIHAADGVADSRRRTAMLAVLAWWLAEMDEALPVAPHG